MKIQKKRSKENSTLQNTIPLTDQSFKTNRMYENQSIIQSFLDQFNTSEKQFYLDAIIKLQNVLKYEK